MVNIDLNLLRTFDAIMEQRSVTRAANHLGVTQPAVSHALARLRAILDDPLFIRVQNGLQPTARAEEIAGGVRRGLRELQDATAPTVFDPMTAERHFTISASSYFCALLVPVLIERIRAEAPGITLRLVPSSELFVPLLDRGDIDLALGVSVEVPKRLVVEPLYKERIVWIASPGNPMVFNRLRPSEMDDAAQIILAPGRPFGSEADEDASSVGRVEWEVPLSRRNRIAVYDSHTAVALVARTDLIARVPERVAKLAAADGRVVTLDWLPEKSFYQIAMIWHSRQRSDQGLAWLRKLVRDVAGATERDE